MPIPLSAKREEITLVAGQTGNVVSLCETHSTKWMLVLK